MSSNPFQSLRAPSQAQRGALYFRSLDSSSCGDNTYVDNIWNWDVFWQYLDYIADRLAQQGVGVKSGVALMGKNSLQIVLYYLAGLSLGARVLPINPQFPTQKIHQIIADCDIQFYFSDFDIPLSYDLSQNNKKHYQRQSAENWQSGLTLTLTSGSSGKPKAVVHDIHAHLANAVGVCELMNFTQNHSWLLSLPLFHVSGQGIVWRWLSQGGCLHINEENVYQSLAKVTHASLVPTQLQRYLAHKPEHVPQTVLLGGSHIEPLLCEQAEKLGITTYCGYGMTEMASTVSAKRTDEKSGVGQLLSGRECKIIDGQIYLRGAGLALGYWQNGKIRPLTDKQGWFKSGDRGQWYRNELQILGRSDNMFISGGENIQPEEIEQRLLNHPNVEQVFVVPQQDVEFGERPVAVVKFSTTFDQLQLNNLLLWLSNKLERFKQPIAYYPWDEAFLKSGGQIKISRRRVAEYVQLHPNKRVQV